MIEYSKIQGENPTIEDQTEWLNDQFIKEVVALSKIKSDYVISFVKGLKVSQNRFYLITELCNGGDLRRLLHLRKKINEADAKIIIA